MRVALAAALAVVIVIGAGGCGAADTEMPTVGGQRLDDAYDTLDEAGISGSDIELAGGSVWIRSNWTVCGQTPEPGASVSDSIILTIGRQCRDGSAYDPLHGDERKFIGKVTAHHDYSPGELTVDEAGVVLDLIVPVGQQDGCYSSSTRLEAAARRAQRKMLPVGTRVLVVRSDDFGDEAFVHALRGEEQKPQPREPESSVNERLVRGGSWEPKEFIFDGPWNSGSERYRPRLDEMTGTQRAYGPHIASAAIVAREQRVAGYGTCLAEMERERRIEMREKRQLLRTEDDDRGTVPDPSYGDGHPCLPGERDGDGDGLCGES